MNTAREVTARELTISLQDLLRRERAALADLVVALADFDARRLWVDLGHASFFSFLHRELGLSKGAAFYRKTAAELVQKFPEIVEPLRDGRLCYTTVVELARVITPENRREVLPRFFQLSRREAQEVSAEFRPVEPLPRRAVVTTGRVGAANAAPEVAPVLPLPGAASDVRHAPVHPGEPPRTESPESIAAPPRAAGARGVAPSRAPSVEPLTAAESRLHVTVSRRFLEKLEAARDALSHSHPDAGLEEILEAGLDLLLERSAKRKGLVKKPRTVPPPSADPDYVPAHVRRAVWKRDGGKCQWPLDSGGVCGSTRRVELDHTIARALGGPPTILNLRGLCRAHNLLAARQVFGDACMDRYARNPRDAPR